MPFNSFLEGSLLTPEFSPFLVFIASSLFAVTVIAALSQNNRQNKGTPSIPCYIPGKSDAGDLKKRWIYDNVNLLQEAYNKFPNKPFKIWTTEGNQIVIPPRYTEELKMLSDTIFPSALRSFFLGSYIWPIELWKLDYGHVVMHKDLNKHMSTLFPDMRDEIDAKLLVEFPESRDWTPVLVYPKVVRMVSRVNAKIFVGNGLHENEEWITINSNYTKNIFISSAKLRFFHPVLRPFVQYFIPELRTVWQCNRRARELVAPIIAQRKLLEKDADYKKPNDSIQWLRDLVPGTDKDDAHFHGILQLGIGAVSVNTTSQLISNAIFNLATLPEYMPVLREEIEDVLSQVGGTWTMDSMGQLKKLDSFMKETLRHSGHLTVTFQRLARQPVTLSDGTQIPVGTMAFTPANAVNFDQEIYPDANTFDGWRFYNLRQASPENEKKYQFVSTTKEQLQFGLGRHSCPGRWFASHEIKLMLVGLIDRFDFRLKHGEGRPKTMLFQTNQLPDPKAEILFKNRK